MGRKVNFEIGNQNKKPRRTSDGVSSGGRGKDTEIIVAVKGNESGERGLVEGRSHSRGGGCDGNEE